jgi:DNA-binding transcriptional MerR regulator
LVRPSGRSAGGFRIYTDDDIERLRLVKRMKPLDFSLDEMRDPLGARDLLAAGTGDREGTARTRQRLAAYAAVAEQRCQLLRAPLRAPEPMAGLLRREASYRHGTRP